LIKETDSREKRSQAHEDDEPQGEKDMIHWRSQFCCCGRGEKRKTALPDFLLQGEKESLVRAS
jgi:hypothetical protein